MKNIDWVNTIFLFGTFLTTVIGVPAYIWRFGLDPFHAMLFVLFFIATGMSITLGYHRLFSHLTFRASLPVRLFTLIFGAAAFEASALTWCADHRRHHKFVGHDDDPYDIRKGFWYAHIGWLLFRQTPDAPLVWVRDLQKYPLIRWQHRFYIPLAILAGFFLPAAIGFVHGGWTSALGAFLIAGVARVVFVHHMTFCINSLCHWIGRQPYSSKSSARDSLLMALFTFGEGYHNYHHEFQYDYRNGPKLWQFDPTKWTIKVLNWFGLVKNLRRVSKATILKAEIAEQERRVSGRLAHSRNPQADFLSERIQATRRSLDNAIARWATFKEEYSRLRSLHFSVSRAHQVKLKGYLRDASARLSASLRNWKELCASVESTVGFDGKNPSSKSAGTMDCLSQRCR